MQTPGLNSSPCFFFVISARWQALASPPPVTLGSARFTVLTPQVIRMEYSPSGHFVDAPSLFAIHRDVTLTAEESAAIHITVGPTDVVDRHRPNRPHLPRRRKTLQRDKICTASSAGIAIDRPGAPPPNGSSEKRAQAIWAEPSSASTTLLPPFRFKKAFSRATAGIISKIRNGFCFRRTLKMAGSPRARPNTDQTDGFLFGYGLITPRHFRI